MMSVIDDPKISGFVDDALVHLFSVQFRLGFGDPVRNIISHRHFVDSMTPMTAMTPKQI